MAFDASEENNARARLIRLRDTIAGLSEGRFSYKEPWPPEEALGTNGVPCNTPVCVLGWARVMRRTSDTEALTSDAVGAWLGLDAWQSFSLFFNAPSPHSAITRAGAVRVLDHLIATGQVDWSKAFEDAPAETVTA
jgi:hypothetical protein